MATDIVSSPLPPTSLFCDSMSDDEESFVVLGTSLPPSPANDVKEVVDNHPIDGSVVDEAISLVQTHLSALSDSTSSFPSMPKVSEQELVSLAERLHLSTITTNSSLDLSPDEIQHKVDLLVEENIKLKETLHQNNLAMKHQYETLVLWQEDVLKVHQSHKEKFAETKKYIESLKIENARLTQALALEQSKSSKSLESVSSKASESPSILINTDVTKFELETARKKISSLEMEIQLLQNDKLTWEKSCELENSYKSQSEQLQKEHDYTINIHAKETAAYIKQLQQSDSLQKILLDEIKMLKSKAADHSKCIKQETLNNTQERLDNVQEQLMAAQMHITKLDQLSNQDKEIINDMENKIANLELNAQTINDNETKITKLEVEIQEYKDTINALQTQLELYKSDFDAENQLRQNINTEKEQIASDLQQLQRRNNQLLAEVEQLRNNDFVHVGRLEQAATETYVSPSAPEDSPPLTSTYICPLCMSRFRSLRLLEEHVEYCLNNAP